MEVKIEHILCSIDLSEYSGQVLACGLALAKVFDARLRVRHVIDISSAALFSECLKGLK